MTRSDLANDWVERFLMTPAHAQSCVDKLYRDFCAAVAAGGEVQLRGIGTWKTAVRKNGRRVIQMRPSGALVRAPNKVPPRIKGANASLQPIPAQRSARIPVLIARLFDKWPSRDFLQEVGRIAGLDRSLLLRILEEMLRCGVRYDPALQSRSWTLSNSTSGNELPMAPECLADTSAPPRGLIICLSYLDSISYTLSSRRVY